MVSYFQCFSWFNLLVGMKWLRGRFILCSFLRQACFLLNKFFWNMSVMLYLQFLYSGSIHLFRMKRIIRCIVPSYTTNSSQSHHYCFISLQNPLIPTLYKPQSPHSTPPLTACSHSSTPNSHTSTDIFYFVQSKSSSPTCPCST